MGAHWFVCWPGTEPWLGHLHIVIRDWNSGESRVQVQRLLMGEEVAAPGRGLAEDAKRRNAIRREIFANFASVNVWLLPSPVERTAATTLFSSKGERTSARLRVWNARWHHAGLTRPSPLQQT